MRSFICGVVALLFASAAWAGTALSGPTDTSPNALSAVIASTALQGESSWSVAFWANGPLDSSGAAVVIDISTTSNATLFLVYPIDSNGGGNGVRVFYNNATLMDENDAPDRTTEWHHFMFVSNSATDHTFYVDGVAELTSATSKTLAATVNFLVLFAREPGSTQNFLGDLAHVSWYTHPLSEAERSMLVNGCMVLPNAEHYFPLQNASQTSQPNAGLASADDLGCTPVGIECPAEVTSTGPPVMQCGGLAGL